MLEKINPQESSRAFAYKHLSASGLPTPTLIKRLDVTKVWKTAKKTGRKFNCIMNYLILKTALSVPEFLLKVDGETQELYKSDKLALTFMSKKDNGELAYCSVMFSEDYSAFEKDYINAINYCKQNNCDLFIKDYATVGTSTLPWTALSGVISGYWSNFANPFVVMTKVEKKFFKTYMNVSLQFHHLQMDGQHGCIFLENLQNNIKNFK